MNTLFDQINNLIFTKQNLERTIVSLDSLKSKLKGGKDLTEEKAREVIMHTMSEGSLKDLFLNQIEEGKLEAVSINNLQDILKKLQDSANKSRMVDVTLSLPLSEDDLEELAKQIEKKLQEKPILRVKIDPNILGGIILKENTHIYDSSLKTHLETYESEWMKQLKKSQKKAV